MTRAAIGLLAVFALVATSHGADKKTAAKDAKKPAGESVNYVVGMAGVT